MSARRDPEIDAAGDPAGSDLPQPVPATGGDPRLAVLGDVVNRLSAERREILERSRARRAEVERLSRAVADLQQELAVTRAALVPGPRTIGARLTTAASSARRRVGALRRRATPVATRPSGRVKAPRTGGPGAVLKGTVGGAEGVPPILAGDSPGAFRRSFLERLDATGPGGLRIVAAEALETGEPDRPVPRPAVGWPDVMVADAPDLDIRRLPRHVVVVARVVDPEPWLRTDWFSGVDVVLVVTPEVADAVGAGSVKTARVDPAACAGAVDGPGVRAALHAWATARRFALLVQAPTHEAAETSGDYHYARGLQRQLERRGHPSTVYLQSQWGLPVTSREDIVLHLWGRREYTPRPGQVTALWVLYHPELLTNDLLDRYDRVFAGSRLLADRLAAQTHVPVEPLHQATDPESLLPRGAESHHELLFIGNSRGTRRTVIDDLGPTARDFAVFGLGWEPELLDPRYLRAGTVAHADLGSHYAAADIVLNDHWPEAAEAGLITNRLYDILAAGGFALTDPVPGLAEEFDDGVATYAGPADLALQVERYLANPALRSAMTARGREAVLARHTFGHRVDRLIEILLPMAGLREQ